MSKLYIGSMGTLGLITRANFKALPLPEARRLALAPVADDQRDRVIAAIGSLTIEPSAALLIDGFPRIAQHGTAAVRLALLFEGSEAVVERATRDARSALGRAGVGETLLIDGAAAERTLAEIVDAYIETNERSLTYRAPGLPSTAWPRTRIAATIAHEFGLAAESIADLRTGDAIVRCSARTIGAFADTLAALDAGVRRTIERSTILAGAPRLRAAVDAWGAPARNARNDARDQDGVRSRRISSRRGVMSARYNALVHDVRAVVQTVLRSPDRFVRLIRLGPRGLASMARFLVSVVPRASHALESIRERAAAIPNRGTARTSAGVDRR